MIMRLFDFTDYRSLYEDSVIENEELNKKIDTLRMKINELEKLVRKAEEKIPNLKLNIDGVDFLFGRRLGFTGFYWCYLDGEGKSIDDSIVCDDD